ncbi:MAG: hypothetical protein JWO03_1032 [Bacteroidetes bacterium]|nr:hypothetical protein [Bacteroidota bacterium]
MSYKPRSLFSIISEINTNIFLPHIQRPFVWERRQMSKLFDSLMRGYPIQTLLFWKTKEEIKVRKFMDTINSEIDLSTLYHDQKSQKDVEKTFVLDGQQRLQTLFCLYNGSFIDKKTGAALEAYVKVNADEPDVNTNQIHNIEFYPVGSAQSLPLFKIKDLMGKYNQKTNDDISDEINDLLDPILNDLDANKKSREKVVRRNISWMVSILREDKHFWIEELDGLANSYPYKTVLEIFIRVNSGGTKLDASDLMFAAMKELSPEIEANLEEMSTVLSTGNLSFEVETILKGILLVNDKGAVVDQAKFKGDSGKALVKSIDDSWDSKFQPAFEALKDFIVTVLKLDSEKVIRSYNSFVPIFEYLYFNPTPTQANKSRLKSFYYRAQLFNWFSSQTDGILDYLHNNFLKNCTGADFPITAIANYFEVNRHNKVKLDMATLTDHSQRFFLLHLMYVESHGVSAFNVALKNNSPHIDHIYPKSKLQKHLFNLGPKDINHIGNYRFVGATDNIRKRAEEPASYFTKLKNSGVNIATHLLVPSYSVTPASMLMDLPTYSDFKSKRTDEIFKLLEPIVNFV